MKTHTTLTSAFFGSILAFTLSTAMAQGALPPVRDKPAQIVMQPISAPSQAQVATIVAPQVQTVASVAQRGDTSALDNTVIPLITLLALALLSIGAVAMLVIKLITQWRVSVMAEEAKSSFEDIEIVRDATNSLRPQSPYRLLAEFMLEAFRKHGVVSTQISLSAWLAQSARTSISGLHDLIQTENSLIKAIAVGAPIIGVFGTICQISNVLILSGSTQFNMSPYIGGALVMTIVGLGISLPLFIGLHYLEKNNKRNLKAFKAFGDDMNKLFLATANRMRYKPLSIEQQDSRVASLASPQIHEQAQIAQSKSMASEPAAG